MTEQVKVGGSEIDVLVSQLQRAHQDLTGILDQLRSELDILSQAWSGSAQEAYRTRQVKWNQALLAMNDEINRLRRRTQESNEAFAAAERSNARIWGQR